MKINNETRIGIFVVVVILMLGSLTWKAGDIKIRQGGYEIKAHFHNIDGVALNAPVNVNGLEVGRVSGIDILYGKKTVMELTLWLKEGVKLHESAQAYVKNLGFLGEKYVGLTTGDDDKPFLKSGAVIVGNEPPSFEKLIGQGTKIAENLEQISMQLNDHLKTNSASIDSIIANLDVAVKDVASISSKVRKAFDSNDGAINDILLNVNKATKNFEEMSYDLKENPWKLLHKEKTKKRKQ